MPKPIDDLRVTGADSRVTGRYFHLNTGTTVKLSNHTNAYTCLARECINAREANACVHCTVAAMWHLANPDAGEMS